MRGAAMSKQMTMNQCDCGIEMPTVPDNEVPYEFCHQSCKDRSAAGGFSRFWIEHVSDEWEVMSLELTGAPIERFDTQKEAFAAIDDGRMAHFVDVEWPKTRKLLGL